MQKTKCAITGQNPKAFSFGLDEEDSQCINLKMKLLQQIGILHKNGIHIFITDCSVGVNMWAAEIILELISLYSDIQLICVIPYEEQSTKWPKEYRDRYFTLHEKCTRSILINTAYTNVCLMECSQYLVNACDVLLAVCDIDSPRLSKAGYMVSYAKQINRDVIFINPKTLAVTSTILAV